MIKTKKWVLLLWVLLLLLGLLVAFGIWTANKTWNKLWSDVAYKMRYIECEPNKLFIELEQTFQIKMPQQIWEAKTARSYGSWDSTSSSYIVRFCAEPIIVDGFISSFPEKIDFIPYSKQEDTRYAETKRYFAPSWFTETINEGKIGRGNQCEIYIDTSVARRYVVYLSGFGDLPLPDANSPDGNKISGLQKKTGEEDSNTVSIEKLLSQERLMEIYKHPKFTGTGGPMVPLPNGTSVTRDTIYEAIQPLVKQGPSICPSLLKALKSDETHIRYGALMALKLITKADIDYYPYFPPSDPRNLKAYEKWANYIKTMAEN